MKPRSQLLLDLRAPQREAVVRPTEDEKRATRVKQGGRCVVCEKPSKRALDVVRRDGVLVGLCRRDRLRWDAPWRCAKGAGKRRRRVSRNRKPRAGGQLEIGGR